MAQGTIYEANLAPDRPLMKVRETAHTLGVHENTVRRWANAGLLRVVTLPTGVRRFRPDDVAKLRRSMYDRVGQAALNASSQQVRSAPANAASATGASRGRELEL
jgi:hypothetical protein